MEICSLHVNLQGSSLIPDVYHGAVLTQLVIFLAVHCERLEIVQVSALPHGLLPAARRL